MLSMTLSVLGVKDGTRLRLLITADFYTICSLDSNPVCGARVVFFTTTTYKFVSYTSIWCVLVIYNLYLRPETLQSMAK